MTALTARARVIGKGRARKTVVELIDRWGLVHAASSAEYEPLDYRVRLDAHHASRGWIDFPPWVPLTVCGQPAYSPYFTAQ